MPHSHINDDMERDRGVNGGIEWRTLQNNSVDNNGMHNHNNANIDRQVNGFMQVSVEARDKILQNQRDAALRRRKQQLQSGFIKSIHTTAASMRLDKDPHVVPSIRTTFSTPRELHIGKQSIDSVREVYRNEKMISQSGTFIMSSNQATILPGRKETSQSETLHLGSTRNADVDVVGCHKIPGQKQASQNTIERDELSPKHGNSCDNDQENLLSKEKRLTKSPSTLTTLNNHRADCSEEKQDNPDQGEEVNYMTMTSEFPERTNHSKEKDEDDEDKDSKQSYEGKLGGTHNFWDSIDWNNSDEVKRVLMAPYPKNAGTVKCYIRRHKGKAKLFPEYRVYLEEGDIFLMTSKKRAKKQSSNYLISIGRNDYNKRSSNIIGKLRANFLGTEFQIYDGGKNPKSIDPFFDEQINEEPRSELGAVLYTSNIIGNRGPRKMQVCINRVANDERDVKRWQPVHKDEEMLQSFKNKTETAIRHLLMYENRQPKWNEDIGSYVLNFNQRVNLASVKNFQLIDPYGNDDRVVLQFGRSSKDQFIMDVQWPMSLFQAFAICLSSCDSKIACD